MQSRLGAPRADGFAYRLPVDGDHASAGLAEARHKLLEASAELVGIEMAKHAAEGVVARNAVLQPQKAAKKLLLGHGKDRHVDRSLTARQHRAKRDHQHFEEIVASGVPPPRIPQFGKTIVKSVHQLL